MGSIVIHLRQTCTNLLSVPRADHPRDFVPIFQEDERWPKLDLKRTPKTTSRPIFNLNVSER